MIEKLDMMKISLFFMMKIVNNSFFLITEENHYYLTIYSQEPN